MANAINSLKLGSGTYVFTTPYATCGTAAAEAAKVAATTPGSNFSLETGARVTVKFTVTNTAANPTLNVNSTGAKAIYYRGSTISAGYLAANRTYEFVYNGTQYDFIGDIDTNTDTNTNTSHSHDVGVGLVGSGNASTSGGTYTYKAKLKDETKNANDSLARPSANANRLYPVEVDKSGYLAVTVPWSDTNTDTDTKNTAGSTDTSSKIFLIGATSQAANPITYSHDTVYVGTDGCLYSNSSQVVTLANEQTISGKKIFTGGVQFGTNTVFNNGGIQIPAANAFKVMGMYDVSLPSKSGTIALTSDIPSSTTSSTFDDSIDIWDTTYSGDKYISIDASGSGSIHVNNDDEGSSLILNFPAIKDGTYTIATTSEIFSGSNTYTGITTFNSSVYCKMGVLATSYSDTNNYASYGYNSISRHTSSTNYTFTLPSKSGTIALTSDIPNTGSFAKLNAVNEFTKSNFYSKNQIISNNKSLFITNSAFEVIDDQTIETGPTTEIAPNKIELWPVSGAPFSRYISSEYVNSKVKLFVNTESGKSNKIYFPETTGTLALTKDIPIKSATLSGTTLSITLS